MHDGFVRHGAEGVLGGAFGTLLMKQGMMLASRMPPALKPPEVRGDPAEAIVSRLEEARGRPLGGALHARVARALPWAYGISWGGLLGLGVSSLRLKTTRQTLLAGAGMGALAWAVGYVGWLPAMGLARPVKRQGAGHIATSLVTHVLFGVAAAIPIALIDQRRKKRRSWWERLID
jgi:hypothetical protein